MSDNCLVCVLNDGDTYTALEGCMIAEVPDSVCEGDYVEDFLKNGDYDHLHLGPIEDSDMILRWMKIFFPDMEIYEDLGGQVLIHTNVYK